MTNLVFSNMHRPQSFCTISTRDTYPELLALLYCLQSYHPGTPVVISCDSYVASGLRSLKITHSLLAIIVCMDKYTGKGRNALEAEGLFLGLLSCKMIALEQGIKSYGDCMYIDSDLILLQPIHINKSSQLILSPAYIDPDLQDQTGAFNAGYLWSSCLDVPVKWKSLLADSTYYDQKCLDILAKDFAASLFNEGHNIMPWRCITPVKSLPPLQLRLSVLNGILHIERLPVISIHSHFLRRDFFEFNKLVIRNLMMCTDPTALTSISIAVGLRKYYI